ncbi:hypothetical protein CWO17_23995 [Vibrio sp. 10N.286.45.A3]|nr:hypothetical protein CWO17_23995 [Vibrio sp. 10N.286.45.A3]
MKNIAPLTMLLLSANAASETYTVSPNLKHGLPTPGRPHEWLRFSHRCKSSHKNLFQVGRLHHTPLLFHRYANLG